MIEMARTHTDTAGVIKSDNMPQDRNKIRTKKKPKRVKVTKEAKALRKLQFENGGISAEKKGRQAVVETEYVILLFYKYISLKPDEVDEVMKFHEQAESLFHLSGRVRIGVEGINGTVASTPEKIAAYRKNYGRFPKLQGTEFKVAQAFMSSPPFPKYHLKQVREIVRLGIDAPVEKTAAHLSPQQFHDLAKGDEFTLLDVRNYYESEIGHFPSAVRTCTRTFDELPQWVEANSETLKKKPLLMYCTGGIRCERASSYLKGQGITVRGQLHGGIHEYVEWSNRQGVDSLFKGRNFVFDRRIMTDRVDDRIVGKCGNCHCEHDTFDRNNRCRICRCLVLVCEACAPKRLTCSQKRDRVDMRCSYCVATGSFKIEKEP
jgi:predicted sulfurtransferase